MMCTRTVFIQNVAVGTTNMRLSHATIYLRNVRCVSERTHAYIHTFSYVDAPNKPTTDEPGTLWQNLLKHNQYFDFLLSGAGRAPRFVVVRFAIIHPVSTPDSMSGIVSVYFEVGDTHGGTRRPRYQTDSTVIYGNRPRVLPLPWSSALHCINISYHIFRTAKNECSTVRQQ